MSGPARSSSYDPEAVGIPSAAAASRAFARSRDAIASTDIKFPRCIPGITFFIPMAAVLRTPQRIFLDMVANDTCKGGNHAKGELDAWQVRGHGTIRDWNRAGGSTLCS